MHRRSRKTKFNGVLYRYFSVTSRWSGARMNSTFVRGGTTAKRIGSVFHFPPFAPHSSPPAYPCDLTLLISTRAARSLHLYRACIDLRTRIIYGVSVHAATLFVRRESECASESVIWREAERVHGLQRNYCDPSYAGSCQLNTHAGFAALVFYPGTDSGQIRASIFLLRNVENSSTRV